MSETNDSGDHFEPPVNTHEAKTCLSQECMKTMDEFRKNNLLCDATIRLDDGSKFNVHRATMSANSEYFRALFTNSFSGDNRNVIIPKIRKEIMEGLINYTYVREFQLTEVNMIEMLVISDYVGMMGCIRRCVEYIVEKLKPENCIGLYMISKYILDTIRV